MSRIAFPVVLAASLALGCAHYRRVQVPPAQDLSRYPSIGILQFSSPVPRGTYPANATRQFLQHVFQAQPGVRIIELGEVKDALAGVGKSQLDGAAIQALAAKSRVDAIFAGTLELTDAKTSFNLAGLSSKSGSVSAEVTATLAASLYDAGGAILWTQLSRAKDSAGGVAVSSGSIGIGTDGTDVAYGRMIDFVTSDAAEPFRSHWRRERIEE